MKHNLKMLIVIPLFTFFFAIQVAEGAISYGSEVYSSGSGGALTISSVTVGADEILVAVCYLDTNSTPTETLKWNTTEDMTRLGFEGADVGGVSVWYLNDPTATTANLALVTSFTGNVTCVATPIAGADTSVTTPNSDVHANTGTSNNNTLYLTTANANSEIFSGAFRNGATNSALSVSGTGQTVLSETPSGTTLKT